MAKIIKWGVLVILLVTNTAQYVFYRGIRRKWNSMPTVSVKILESSLTDHLTVDGERVYEANIRYEYNYGGEIYQSSTPAIHGPLLFPLWNFEADLIKKYKVGETYPAKVSASNPEIAYLEIAPLSRLSAVGLPIMTAAYTLAVIGYSWLVVQYELSK